MEKKVIDLVDGVLSEGFENVAKNIIKQLQAVEFTKDAKTVLLKMLKESIQLHKVEKAHKMTIEEAYQFLADFGW